MYMSLKSGILVTVAIIAANIVALASPAVTDSLKPSNKGLPIRKLYVGTALDGAIFSTALIDHTDASLLLPAPGTKPLPNNTPVWAPLRFSLFLNIGFTFNYNFSRHFGMFTGIDLKNIGYIEETGNDQMIKRRSYNAGIPLGLRIGNMGKNNMAFFLGGGIDYTINYKEKRYLSRNEKVVYTEWFSSRTPTYMPYVFAGISTGKGLSLKAQYYPNDFLSPFPGEARKNVRIMAVTLGLNLHLDKEPDFKFATKPTQTIAL
jgi:hypothetical protein